MPCSCSYATHLCCWVLIDLHWFIEILTLRSPKRAKLSLAPGKYLPAFTRQRQAMLTSSGNIANHKVLQALNQTWQPFLKHNCVAVFISFLIWLANTKLPVLVASHGVDVPRGTQHDGVRHTARHLVDDCIKATNFRHHGHGRNRLAAFVILCSGS